MKSYTLKNVTKIISDNVIFENINVSFESGKIYGLIGGNGSGKTMLIRVMAGLIKPTEGYIEIDGQKCDLTKKKNIDIGVVIENISLYHEMTGVDNLKFLASINKKVDKNRIEEIIEQVGLDPKDKKKVRKYSLGMKQKLTLAQCFMEYPDLILLDEPTNALDEESTVRILDIIRSHAEKGAIVLIVSHIKDDIFSVCDKIYTIREKHLCEVEQ